MSVLLVLGLLFCSLTLVGYVIISSGKLAFESQSERIADTTEARLKGLFLFADTRRLLALYLGGMLVVPTACVLVIGSIPLAVGAFVVALILPRWLLARLATRRREAISAALPDALAQIAGGMRAGATFITAIQAMVDEDKGPLGQEFGLLLREHRVGARLDDALDNLGERVQSEDVDLVISAALIAQEVVGGNLAEILHRLSETLRRKLEMEGKIRALTSQGILQGRVVTALPFMILLALLFIEPEATRPIFTSLLGWCFLAVIIVMQCLGGLMIRRIVRIDI